MVSPCAQQGTPHRSRTKHILNAVMEWSSFPFAKAPEQTQKVWNAGRPIEGTQIQVARWLSIGEGLRLPGHSRTMGQPVIKFKIFRQLDVFGRLHQFEILQQGKM